MTPLLATLATSVAVVGITKVITQSKRINVTDPFIVFLRDGTVIGLSAGVVAAGLLTLIYWFLMHRTRWGMQAQATGGGVKLRRSLASQQKHIKRYLSSLQHLPAFLPLCLY